MTPFDSRPDTYRHIGQVRHYLTRFVNSLLFRAEVHDASKLETPEKEAFDELPGRLGDYRYPSPEYKAGMRSIKPALDHHYAVNSHHPEHYPNGIRGMNLCDVVEMLCDWKAASERQSGGDLRASIIYNQERFGYSDDLREIFLNTLPMFGIPRDVAVQGVADDHSSTV